MKRPQVNPKELLINNLVPILFIVICIIGIPLSGYSGTYLLNEILSEATGQPIEKINADTERDNYMRASEACAYGLVDKVISSRTDQSQE